MLCSASSTDFTTLWKMLREDQPSTESCRDAFTLSSHWYRWGEEISEHYRLRKCSAATAPLAMHTLRKSRRCFKKEWSINNWH